MRPLKIQLHTPFSHTRRGNGITADRWADIFGQLGHTLVDHGADVLVALHAKHSHPEILKFKAEFPGRPVVLALTGTDIYRDVQVDEEAQLSVRLADRFIVLQPHALTQLAPEYRERAHVIYQSAVAPVDAPPRPSDHFRACVIGHLREVKDPFRTAEALRLLPPDSRVRVVHLGSALDPEMRSRAEQEVRANPRYEWRGEVTREETLHVLASSHLMVLTSVMEGGANVLTEAIACGTPAILSRMGASIGIMGADYPGLFEVGDTQALARLLQRAESDRDFYNELQQRCEAKRPLIDPAREQQSWRMLLEGLAA
ncbi:MAG: TIGR04348 family glycosyltransferase [Planctomycetes bacterium]|nr:TIGR04348 family glycosyltransferase [Planctomycetota bacterium]